jgi:2-oxoglutarate ferredoxin oxidoreductase subunit delta
MQPIFNVLGICLKSLTGSDNHLSLIYESERVTMTGKKRSFPKADIYRAWCKACGICAAFCPASAITRDEAGYPSVDGEKCIRCGWCEIRCPDFAITVERKKEEGMTNKGSFEQKGPE